LLVEGAGVKEISLVYSFDDALKKRLAADVDKYGVVKQNALPGGSLPNEPYEFAGAKFTVNQIPVLLDPYGDTRNFHSNMEIVDSSAFWRKFSLQPLAVALCGTTPADAAYKMKLIANIRYGDAKLTVAQIAAISVQCTLSLTSPPVHQTRIQLRYANGEAPELTKCEALSCGEWISDN
jgi:hypothetical protein